MEDLTTMPFPILASLFLEYADAIEFTEKAQAEINKIVEILKNREAHPDISDEDLINVILMQMDIKEFISEQGSTSIAEAVHEAINTPADEDEEEDIQTIRLKDGEEGLAFDVINHDTLCINLFNIAMESMQVNDFLYPELLLPLAHVSDAWINDHQADILASLRNFNAVIAVMCHAGTNHTKMFIEIASLIGAMKITNTVSFDEIATYLTDATKNDNILHKYFNTDARGSAMFVEQFIEQFHFMNFTPGVSEDADDETVIQYYIQVYEQTFITLFNPNTSLQHLAHFIICIDSANNELSLELRALLQWFDGRLKNMNHTEGIIMLNMCDNYHVHVNRNVVMKYVLEALKQNPTDKFWLRIYDDDDISKSLQHQFEAIVRFANTTGADQCHIPPVLACDEGFWGKYMFMDFIEAFDLFTSPFFVYEEDMFYSILLYHMNAMKFIMNFDVSALNEELIINVCNMYTALYIIYNPTLSYSPLDINIYKHSNTIFCLYDVILKNMMVFMEPGLQQYAAQLPDNIYHYTLSAIFNKFLADIFKTNKINNVFIDMLLELVLKPNIKKFRLHKLNHEFMPFTLVLNNIRSDNSIYKHVTHTHALFESLSFTINNEEDIRTCLAYPAQVFIDNDFRDDGFIIPLPILNLFRIKYPRINIMVSALCNIYNMNNETIRNTYSANIVESIFAMQEQYANANRIDIPNQFMILFTLAFNYICNRKKQ